MANSFNQLLYTDNLAEGTDKLNANFQMLQNAPTEGRGVASVALLPLLPDADYPENSIVFYTVNNKLYKNVGEVWLPVVNTADLEGQVSGAQIEDGALDIAKFAANLKPPIIVSALPALPDVNYPEDTIVAYDGKLYQNIADVWEGLAADVDLPEGVILPVSVVALPALPDPEFPEDSIVIYDSKLYRNDADVWTPIVNAADMDGQIQAGQIAADAVLANNIVAGAIGTGHLAANSVTASKLAIGNTVNLVANPQITDSADGWSIGNNVTIYGGQPGFNAIYIETTTSPNYDDLYVAYSKGIPVTPGEQYYVQFVVAGNGGCEAGVYFTFGSGEDYLPVWEVTDVGGGEVSEIITVPNGAIFMRFYVRKPDYYEAAIGSYIEVQQPVINRAGEGKLIVDGAITTDKLAANSVTAAKIQAGAIGADQIAANSITAEKLRIGSTDNILQNSSWLDGVTAPWTLTGNAMIIPLPASPGDYTAMVTSDGSNNRVVSDWFSATTGESFVVQARVTSNLGSGVELSLEYRTKPGGGVPPTPPWVDEEVVWSPSSPVTQFGTVHGIVTIPGDRAYRYARLVFRSTGNTGTDGLMTLPKVYRASEGRLIVDGSITATEIAADAIEAHHIKADAIEAHHILAGEIDTDHLAADAVTAGKIAANAIEAEHISAGSITANKLSITDTSNIIQNPNFDGGSDDGWSGDTVTVVEVTGNNRPSDYALQIPNPAGTRYGTEKFRADAQEMYYVSFWARRQSANGRLLVGLEASSVDGQFSGREPAAIAATGATNNTWIKYDGYVMIPNNMHEARFYAENENTSGSWQLTGAVVRRATDSKMLVNGSIELTNADKTNGSLRVRTAGNSEVLRLGNISGRPGVPSGTQFGLWGALGSGVYIPGSAQVVGLATTTATASSASFTADVRYNVQLLSPNDITLPSSVTLVAGQSLYVLPVMIDFRITGLPTYQLDSFNPTTRIDVRNSSGTWLNNSMSVTTAGTYTHWRAATEVPFISRLNVTGTQTATVTALVLKSM